MPLSNPRHKIIRSKDAGGFLKNLAAFLNLSGVIQIQPQKTDGVIEIPINNEAQAPLLQHIVESEDFKLIYNYPPRK